MASCERGNMPKSLPRESNPSKPGRSGTANTTGETTEAASACNYQGRTLALAACYQLLPWPHRLDLSISQGLLFCNSKKKGSSWLILGSSSCVMSLLGVINNSIKISQHTGRQLRTGAGKGPGLGDFRRACNGATSDQANPILQFLWLHKSGLHVSPIWHDAGCHLGKMTCLMFSPHWGYSDGKEFQAGWKQNFTHYFTKSFGPVIDNYKYSYSALLIYSEF